MVFDQALKMRPLNVWFHPILVTTVSAVCLILYTTCVYLHNSQITRHIRMS